MRALKKNLPTIPTKVSAMMTLPTARLSEEAKMRDSSIICESTRACYGRRLPEVCRKMAGTTTSQTARGNS